MALSALSQHPYLNWCRASPCGLQPLLFFGEVFSDEGKRTQRLSTCLNIRNALLIFLVAMSLGTDRRPWRQRNYEGSVFWQTTGEGMMPEGTGSMRLQGRSNICGGPAL